MSRKLPQVSIDGVFFYIDVQAEELRQADNAANSIPFNVFRQRKEGYTFLYDPEHKNSPRTKREAVSHIDRLRWVTLPALMELDPEGIAIKYGIPLEALTGNHQSGTTTVIQATIKMVAKPDQHANKGSSRHFA